MSDILNLVEGLEPTDGFEFRVGDKVFKCRNISGYSQRKAVIDNAKKFAKSARDPEFQSRLLETLPADYDPDKRKQIEQFVKSRQIEDWDLSYQIESLVIEPKLTTLEAIMLTKVTIFVENFNLMCSIHQSKGIAGQFAAMVELEKKDSETTGFGNSDSTSRSSSSKSTRTNSKRTKSINSTRR